MTIFQQAEKLKYGMELPFLSKESVMFLEGTQYQTGSDYTPEQLEMEVQDECPYCQNTGTAYFQLGEDDYNKDVCDCLAGELNHHNAII